MSINQSWLKVHPKIRLTYKQKISCCLASWSGISEEKYSMRYNRTLTWFLKYTISKTSINSSKISGWFRNPQANRLWNFMFNTFIFQCFIQKLWRIFIFTIFTVILIIVIWVDQKLQRIFGWFHNFFLFNILKWEVFSVN